jgi:tRNA dimethylallyltransferase
MIEGGLLDEIGALLGRHAPSARAFGSVGYKQLVPFVRGEQSLEDATREAYLATRTYARKQRNWFRGEPGFSRRMSSEEALADIAAIEGAVRG